MYLSFDHDKKVAFGWSPKCGCSYLRRYLLHLSYPQLPPRTWPEEWAETQAPKWRMLREQSAKNNVKTPWGRQWLRLLQEQDKRLEYFLYKGRSRHLFENRLTGNAGIRTLLRAMALSSGMSYQKFRTLLLQHAAMWHRIRKEIGVDQDAGEPNYQHYKIIFFGRDPYQRLVSAFLYIYGRGHNPRWQKTLEKTRAGIRPAVLKQEEMTFESLVNEMIENGLVRVDAGHFTPQTKGLYRKNLKFDRVFDINQVDHRYLAQLFGREKVDPYFTGEGREAWRNRTPYDSKPHPKAWKLTIAQLKKLKIKPPYQSFYNAELKERTDYLYRNDFLFLQSHNLDYRLEPAA